MPSPKVRSRRSMAYSAPDKFLMRGHPALIHGSIAGERIALEYDFRGPPRPRRTDGASGSSWKSGPSSFGGGSVDVLAGGAKGANSLLARLDRSCVSSSLSLPNGPSSAVAPPSDRRMLTIAVHPVCPFLTLVLSGKSPSRLRAATTPAVAEPGSSRPSDVQPARAPTQPLNGDAARHGLLRVAPCPVVAGAVGGTGIADAVGAVRDRAATGPQRRQRTSTGSSTTSWRRAMPAGIPLRVRAPQRLLLVQRISTWLERALWLCVHIYLKFAWRRRPRCMK